MEITVSIDPDQLRGYSDQHLAFCWHIAQNNPAPHGDHDAADLVKRIGWEIIRRWLVQAPVEMYHHQADANYHSWLTLFAKYEPPPGWGVDPNAVANFHAGRWVPRAPEEIEAETENRTKRGRHPYTTVDPATFEAATGQQHAGRDDNTVA